jgi:DNA-binding response OmpR family regulator
MDAFHVPQTQHLVLLVEDEPDAREACAAILRKHFAVLTAASFKEAVHKILGIAALDAVVTDYHLPDGSGLEVRKLALLKGIPVLLISGDTTIGVLYQPFLPKPFAGAALITSIRNLSERDASASLPECTST